MAIFDIELCYLHFNFVMTDEFISILPPDTNKDDFKKTVIYKNAFDTYLLKELEEVMIINRLTYKYNLNNLELYRNEEFIITITPMKNMGLISQLYFYIKKVLIL